MSIYIQIQPCEECGSSMKFFDQSWAETLDMLVASVLCTNPRCLSVSVVHIHAVQGFCPEHNEPVSDLIYYACGCAYPPFSANPKH